jgi:hypothetical protein
MRLQRGSLRPALKKLVGKSRGCKKPRKVKFTVVYFVRHKARSSRRSGDEPAFIQEQAACYTRNFRAGEACGLSQLAPEDNPAGRLR